MITDRCDNKRHETKTYLRFVHDNKVLVVFKGPGLSPPLLLFTAEAFSLQTCQPTVCVLFDAREPTNQLFFTADIRAIGGRGISAQGWCLNRLSLVQMFDGQGIEPIMVRIDCTVDSKQTVQLPIITQRQATLLPTSVQLCNQNIRDGM